MDYPVLAPAQLSAHLRSLRKSRNLTQAQLAARLGVTQSRLGKIERHPEQTNVGQLMRLMALLGARFVISVAESASSRGGATSVDW